MILLPLAVSASLISERLATHAAFYDPHTADPSRVSAVVLAAADEALAARFADVPGLPRFADFPAAGYAAIPDDDTVLAAAAAYEHALLPPFVRTLFAYSQGTQTSLATPGHHAGEFYRQTTAGELFYRFFGDNLFRTDLSSSDSRLGDMLTHEGVADDAEAHAAKVFHADRTYFVLNGTSASNKVATGALLTPGDLVLFDRNNHKSAYHGAMILAGATPIYLEGARNSYGLIGGIPADALDEDTLRARVAEIDPARARAPRPFRLAALQLSTYDGIFYSAADILCRIGHLCDYILFDSAWVGYEQFLPLLAEMSPLTLPLDEQSPGILVTQSVHKQLAGFSQTSQIHKKDNHLRGQSRYVTHEQFNNAFLLHASTSPSYPLFASLDMNAAMHESPHGAQLWERAARLTTETKKDMLRRLRYIRPLVPPTVNGTAWQNIPTETILSDRRYFALAPDASWHGLHGVAEGQYCLDPCKILAVTPGIRPDTHEYAPSGMPAMIVSQYFQACRFTPEKADLNTLLFLITPAETAAKMTRMVDIFARFEDDYDADTPLETMFPDLVQHHRAYRDYGLRRLCTELHGIYRKHEINRLERDLFAREHFPEVCLPMREANDALTRGRGELVPLERTRGRISLESVLPYPPGILVLAPGERWNDTVIAYFLALEDAMNTLPGFEPELQGIHRRHDASGTTRLMAYVLSE